MNEAVLAVFGCVMLVVGVFIGGLMVLRPKYRYVGHRQRPGWKEPLPFYEFRCEKHGLVENYPQSYNQILHCPKCQEEENKNTNY